MSTPLSHVGQTARPEDSQLSQGSGSSPGSTGGRPQQQQADFAQRPAEQQQQRERQQHQVDAEDDPASDANTESANHPNDE